MSQILPTPEQGQAFKEELIKAQGELATLHSMYRARERAYEDADSRAKALDVRVVELLEHNNAKLAEVSHYKKLARRFALESGKMALVEEAIKEGLIG